MSYRLTTFDTAFVGLLCVLDFGHLLIHDNQKQKNPASQEGVAVRLV